MATIPGPTETNGTMISSFAAIGRRATFSQYKPVGLRQRIQRLGSMAYGSNADGLAKDLLRILGAIDAEKAEQGSSSVAPICFERGITSDTTINSSTAVDLLATTVDLEVPQNAVLKIDASIYSETGVGTFQAYFNVSGTDITSYPIQFRNGAGTVYNQHAVSVMIPVLGGKHVLKWKGKRSAGAGSAIFIATLSRFTCIVLRSDNADTLTKNDIVAIGSHLPPAIR